MRACNYSNCSNTAVTVKCHLITFKFSHFNRCIIQNFLLNRVYLVKRFRAYLKLHTTADIINKSRTIHWLFLITKDHACLLIIYIKNNCCNLRMSLSKSFYKVILGRENRRNRNQNNHDLTSILTNSDKHMAKKSKSVILIVCLDFKRFKHSTDSCYDSVCLLIFQKT